MSRGCDVYTYHANFKIQIKKKSYKNNGNVFLETETEMGNRNTSFLGMETLHHKTETEIFSKVFSCVSISLFEATNKKIST